MSDALDRLCEYCGIEIAYHDLWGKYRPAPERTKLMLLDAMGVTLGSADDAPAALAGAEARAWRPVLPPAKVVRAGAAPVAIEITVPQARAGTRFDWVLALESGASTAGTLTPDTLPRLATAEIAGATRIRVRFELPLAPPAGYHRLTLLEAGTEAATMPLIAAPARCYQSPLLEGTARTFGPAIQLYALRSARNWGIGDFGDLDAVLRLARAAGAGTVGLSPLHALHPSRPEEASPYRPSSRLWVNVMFLDVEAMADFAESAAARGRVAEPAFRQRVQALRATDLVDYAAAAGAKLEILELLFRDFKAVHLEHDTARAREFRAFRVEGGERLRLHALFEALQEHFSGGNSGDLGWRAWPREYHDPAGPAVAAFAKRAAQRVEYYEYLQWQADAQLAMIAERARDGGAALGLYQDLAVGVHPGGAETWMQPGLHALSARVGCPPDEFNLKGQEWGLPPWIPQRLAEAGYEPFIATLRCLMRHAGALRLDHVMGLMRLYWIPEDAGPTEGTYVRYPFFDLLGILALESERNRCLVVGEDLGTVPDAVREAMAEYGLLSYHPMYFERDWQGEFKSASAYPREAVATITTHDLPTLRGYWRGADLETRTELDLFPSPEVRARQYDGRARDRHRLLAVLAREGLLPEGRSTEDVRPEAMDDALARAVHAYVARAPSKILMFQAEDLFGQIDQVNVPGTTDERYPNWRRKVPVALEDWPADARVTEMLRMLRAERG
ncbi:MAG: 4-alpha-glucanotransferase [Burkholderiales bacterium]|nr:4-alpha-glucanotransferase [Burkholderiales bacterium]